MTETFIKTEYLFRDDESISSLSSEEDFCSQTYDIQKNVCYTLTNHTFTFIQKQPWIHNYSSSFNVKKSYSSTISYTEVGCQTSESLPIHYDASSQTDDIILKDANFQINYPIETIPIKVTFEEGYRRLMKIVSFLNNKESWLVWFSSNIKKNMEFHVPTYTPNAIKILTVTLNKKYNCYLMVTECCNKYMLEKWNLSNILVPKMTEIEIPYSDNNSVNLHSTSDYVAIIIKNEIIIYELVGGIKVMHTKYNKNIVGISSFKELFLVVAEDGTFYEIDNNFKVVKLKFIISSVFNKPMACVMKDINGGVNISNFSTSKKCILNSGKLIICLFKDVILLTWIQSTTSNITNYIKIPIMMFDEEGEDGGKGDEEKEEEDKKLGNKINVVCNSDFTLLLLHYHKKNIGVVNKLEVYDDKISIENKICTNQTHTIQFNKKEKIVDFMFDGEFLYSMTESGIITEWELLKNGRKYRRRQYVTSLKNCIKFLSINNRKFIIHTALKISFITINDIDQTF